MATIRSFTADRLIEVCSIYDDDNDVQLTIALLLLSLLLLFDGRQRWRHSRKPEIVSAVQQL